jgi:hypothetical protein
VDRAEITIVMDNFVVVLMVGSEDVHRFVAYDLSDASSSWPNTASRRWSRQ